MIKCEACRAFYLFSAKYKSTNVRLYLSYGIKITLKSHFRHKNVINLLLRTQRCYGRHNVSRISINH